MSSMFAQLPTDWDQARTILEQILQVNAGTTLKLAGTTNKRPSAPQSIGGTVDQQQVTLTWTMPDASSDIVGWRVYKDNENNLIQSIKDPSTLQAIIKVAVTTAVGFWVSSVNAAGRESIKIQAIATPKGINLALGTGAVNLDTQVVNGVTYNKTLQAGMTGTPGWINRADVSLGVGTNPSYPLHVALTNGALRMDNINTGVAYSAIDTNASGRQYAFKSGNSAGNQYITDETAGAFRTNLNATTNWGFYGSPARGIEMFSGTPARISLASNPSPAWSMNDTAVGGREFWVNNGGYNVLGSAGWADATAASGRTYLTSTPQHGFYGSPGAGVDNFSSYYRVNGAAPGLIALDTNASGRQYDFLSGNSAAGVGNIWDGTANAGRTFLTSSPQWGFGGSPGAGVQSLFTSPMRQDADSVAGPNSPAFAANDTHTGGRQFWVNNGGSNGLGQVGVYDQTANAGRTFLNSTPQWGFYGTPARGIELFSGTPARITLASNPSPAWSMNDTAVGGREFWVNEGGYNGTGRGGFADATAGTARQNVDASGNTDFTGSTPNSGFLSAGGVNFADTSGNLQLKNKNIANGSTAAPTTTSGTYAVIPEMTTTFTTKGNKVFISFYCTFTINANTQDAFVAFFRDGSQISGDIEFEVVGSGNFVLVSFSYIDSPTAASHTFDIRWKLQNAGATMTAVSTVRSLEAVELG